jgi:hypothetical protein
MTPEMAQALERLRDAIYALDDLADRACQGDAPFLVEEYDKIASGVGSLYRDLESHLPVTPWHAHHCQEQLYLTRIIQLRGFIEDLQHSNWSADLARAKAENVLFEDRVLERCRDE